jgi:hypothetical protein
MKMKSKTPVIVRLRPARKGDPYAAGLRDALEWVLGDLEDDPTE